jgi:hypothetical protein
MVAIRYAIVGFVPGAWERVAHRFAARPDGLPGDSALVDARLAEHAAAGEPSRASRTGCPARHRTACMIAHATSVSTMPATASTA